MPLEGVHELGKVLVLQVWYCPYCGRKLAATDGTRFVDTCRRCKARLDLRR